MKIFLVVTGLVVGLFSGSTFALTFDFVNGPIATGPTTISQTVDGVTVSSTAFVAQRPGDSFLIQGPFPVGSGDLFLYQRALGASGLTRFGLGLLARSVDGITLAGSDRGSAVSGPGFDNAFLDSSVPKIDFAVFKFSQPVNINDVSVRPVVNGDISIWAAGGNVAPNLSGDLLNAFPGYQIANVDHFDCTFSNGNCAHPLSGFSSLTYLAVGARPPLGTIGNTGAIENSTHFTRNDFWITGLDVSPSATGGGGTTVPEPSTFILLASGLLGLAIYIRLRYQVGSRSMNV